VVGRALLFPYDGGAGRNVMVYLVTKRLKYPVDGSSDEGGDVVGGAAISGDLLSAVISTRYILGFRKDNPNFFNGLSQNWMHF
jgi:hypothetical protein